MQHLVSVVKFVAERGLTFRDDENVGSPRNFFQAKFQKKETRCFWWLVLQQLNKSLITVNYHVASQSFVTLELTNVTSPHHVINIMVRGNASGFIGHPLHKDSVSDPHMGPPTTPGPRAPHHLNPALPQPSPCVRPWLWWALSFCKCC